MNDELRQERDALAADVAALREALNLADTLLHTPERDQDDEWERGHAAVKAALATPSPRAEALLRVVRAAEQHQTALAAFISSYGRLGTEAFARARMEIATTRTELFAVLDALKETPTDG